MLKSTIVQRYKEIRKMKFNILYKIQEYREQIQKCEENIEILKY